MDSEVARGPPLQGRWPCHHQDVACTSDQAIQDLRARSWMRQQPHDTVLQQRTDHFQDPRGLCHHCVNTLQLNCGSPTLGLQRWANEKFCSLTKGSQQFVLQPRFFLKLPPLTTFIKGHFITQIKNIISK